MEGVVVSAKRAGSNITVSVITNAQGRFSIPGRPAAARQLHDHDPRGRLRPRWAEGSDDRGRRTHVG